MNASPKTELLSQVPAKAGSHLYHTICAHLQSPELVECRIAAAYASWGGLSLLSNAVEKFLGDGKTFRTVLGTGNGVTTPDALLYTWYLKQQFGSQVQSKVFHWEYANSEFHPKYYEFVYPDRRIVVVGSSNLTGGGLGRNHELSASISCRHKEDVAVASRLWWKNLLVDSKPVTPLLIRRMANDRILGSEADERQRERARRPFVDVQLPRVRAPLFKHLINTNARPARRHDLLAKADTLSDKPARLYLQILDRETGGGHQIQLPVATLGVFFGVGEGQKREVTFRFPVSGETTRVGLTHFDNNTHRVRLRPLKNLPRPAVVVFERTEEADVFDCMPVRDVSYERTLRMKCGEQTRDGSRRWGLE